jgi:8-oxo-dGTP pyrophosphatase MutT (NUDIX family)
VRHDRAVGNNNMPSGQYYASLARARQGAGALVTTNDGRVVMIDTTYRDFYEVPGGAVELGENAPLACARECREELGMEISIGRLLRWIISATVVNGVTQSCTSTTADQLSRRCS